MMTEREALRKWCPFTRVAMSAGAASNRAGSASAFADMTDETRCLASGCALWRWEYEVNRNPTSRGSCGMGANAMVVMAGSQ